VVRWQRMLAKIAVPISGLMLVGHASATELSVFSYDALGRLIVADRRVTTGAGGASDYEYDAAGNRKSVHSSVVMRVTYLPSNTALYRGQSIISNDGRFELVFLHSGNVVLRTFMGTISWSTNTAGSSANILSMEGGGNLVLYGPAGQVFFASNTYDSPGSQLAVQCDGNLVIYRTNNTAAWASNTSTIC